MHPSAVTGKRPPLSPRDGWLSDGRQVLHFNPVRYSRYSQALELTSGELIPGQAPLLKCRKEHVDTIEIFTLIANNSSSICKYPHGSIVP